MSRAVEYGEAAIGYSGLTRLQQPSIKALAKTKPNVNYRPTRPPRFIQIDGRFIQIVALYVFQRRAYGLRDEEYLRLKVLSCMLPEI